MTQTSQPGSAPAMMDPAPAQANLNTKPSNTPNRNRDAEIQQAAQDLADYQSLTAQGKLGEAGAKLDTLKAHLDRLSGESAH